MRNRKFIATILASTITMGNVPVVLYANEIEPPSQIQLVGGNPNTTTGPALTIEGTVIQEEEEMIEEVPVIQEAVLTEMEDAGLFAEEEGVIEEKVVVINSESEFYTADLIGCTKLIINIDDFQVLCGDPNFARAKPTLKEVHLMGERVVLGLSAFTLYDTLEVVNIPNSKVLASDLSSGTIFYKCLSLREFHAPKATHIPQGLLCNLGNLETIDISGAITIGEFAFAGCPKLDFKEGVSMPVLEKVGNAAFNHCSSLTNFDLTNVTEVGEGAFAGCSSLKDVDLSNLEIIGGSAFFNCSLLREVNLLNVKILGGGAFSNCPLLSLKNDTFSPDLKEIHSSTFEGCVSLERIDFNNVETIGSSAFKNTGIIELEKPKTLTSIGNEAFSGNKNLLSVKEGFFENIETVGYSTFMSCPNLISVNLNGLKELSSNMFANCKSLVDVKFDENMLSIGYRAFASTAIRELNTPSSLSKIEEGAFVSCGDLKTAKLSGVFEVIERGTFYWCDNLIEVEFPDSLKTIKREAFYGTSLKSIDLKNVETLEEDAFSGLMFDETMLIDVSKVINMGSNRGYLRGHAFSIWDGTPNGRFVFVNRNKSSQVLPDDYILLKYDLCGYRENTRLFELTTFNDGLGNILLEKWHTILDADQDIQANSFFSDEEGSMVIDFGLKDETFFYSVDGGLTYTEGKTTFSVPGGSYDVCVKDFLGTVIHETVNVDDSSTSIWNGQVNVIVRDQYGISLVDKNVSIQGIDKISCNYTVTKDSLIAEYPILEGLYDWNNDSQTITLSENKNVKTIVFDVVKSKAEVTVKYLDTATRQELAPSQVMYGSLYQSLIINAPEVEGYTAQMGGYMIYTVTSLESVVLEFLYDATSAKVTIKYIDMDTNTEILPSKVFRANIGGYFTIEQPEIEGYYFHSLSNYDTYISSSAEVEYELYYKKGTLVTQGTVNVVVKDKRTGEVIETLSDPFLKLNNRTGVTLGKSYSTGEDQISFISVANYGNMIRRTIPLDGKSIILSSVKINGNAPTWEAAGTTMLPFGTGYMAVKESKSDTYANIYFRPEATNGILDIELEVASGEITVIAQDATGNALKTEKMEVKLNEEITITAPIIEGMNPNTRTQKVTVTSDEIDKTVVFTYSEQMTNVYVEYIAEDTYEYLGFEMLSLKEGIHTIAAKEFDGYEVIGNGKCEVYAFGGGSRFVTFLYKEIEVLPPVIEEPTIPELPPVIEEPTVPEFPPVVEEPTPEAPPITKPSTPNTSNKPYKPLVIQSGTKKEESKPEIAPVIERRTISFRLGHDKWLVDHVEDSFIMDAVPTIKDNQFYVPVRFLAYSFEVNSALVDWTGEYAKIKDGNTEIKAVNNSTTLVVGNDTLEADSHIYNNNGRIMISITDVRKLFADRNPEITWNAETKQVDITVDFIKAK